MLKKLVSLSLIYSIFLFSTVSTQLFAQPKANDSEDEAPKIEQTAPKTDVKKAFSKDLQKSKSLTDVSEIDFKKMEKTEMKTAAKAKWSKQEKTFLVIFVVALAVGVTLLAIYGKVPKCSQVSCNPDYDEGCYCDDGED